MTSSFLKKVDKIPANKTRTQADLPSNSKLSAFTDQNQRRQPTQKKKNKNQTTPVAEREYASFGRKNAGAVDHSADEQEEAQDRSMKAASGVFDRLVDSSLGDSHCHSKHPDNWKWRKDAPGAPGNNNHTRSISNSGGKNDAAMEGQDPDNFKIRMIPMDSKAALKRQGKR